jgi:TonB family protein
MSQIYSAEQENGINYRALAATIVLHALLLLLFFYWRYSLPVQVINPADMGIEVNLGTNENGQGNNQGRRLGSPAEDNTVAVKSLESNTNKSMLTDKDAAAPEVNNSNSNALKNNTQNKLNNTVHKPKQAKYIYTGTTGEGGNNALQNAPGSNEGNTTGPGDRGVPGGTVGAAEYAGAPGTGGISHTLNGRFIIAYPGREADYQEDGRVIIRITVNPAGDITKTQVLASPTEELRQIALKKCAKVRFNRSETAPNEQFGNITFIFRSHS